MVQLPQLHPFFMGGCDGEPICGLKATISAWLHGESTAASVKEHIGTFSGCLTSTDGNVQILEYYSFDKVRGLGHPDIYLCSASASLLNQSSEHVTGSCIWSSAASDLLDKPNMWQQCR